MLSAFNFVSLRMLAEIFFPCNSVFFIPLIKFFLAICIFFSKEKKRKTDKTVYWYILQFSKIQGPLIIAVIGVMQKWVSVSIPSKEPLVLNFQAPTATTRKWLGLCLSTFSHPLLLSPRILSNPNPTLAGS